MEKLADMVAKFAENVTWYASAQKEQNRTFRLLRALQTIGQILTETGDADIAVGSVNVPGTDVTAQISALESEQDTTAEMRTELTRSAQLLESLIERDLLDADTREQADKALSEYAEVPKSPKARSLRVA